MRPQSNYFPVLDMDPATLTQMQENWRLSFLRQKEVNEKLARQQLQDNWRFTFLREKEVNQKLAQKQVQENGHLTFLHDFCANKKIEILRK